MQKNKLKKKFDERKIFFWEDLNKNIFKTSYASEILLGGASENSNKKWRINFLISKNNVDVFNIFPVKTRLLALYANFRFVKSEREFSFKNFKFMFASHTPVFAQLMQWAGILSNGVSSSNRWLSGTISAQTNLKFLPNYLIVPDPDQNEMITREAYTKKIPVVSINNSDSQFTADFGIYGNNRSFKMIFKIINLVLKLSKIKVRVLDVPLKKVVSENKKWFRVTSQKVIKK